MAEDVSTENRAELIALDQEGDPLDGKDEHRIRVQFNPQTLTVNYKNRVAGSKSKEGGASQYLGQGSSMSVDLLFDVTHHTADSSSSKDVRDRTEEVYRFLEERHSQSNGGDDSDNKVPPNVRFAWGSFQFDGVMDAMTEKLEFFSPEGRPLRATVTIELSRQKLGFAEKQSDQDASAGGIPGGEAQDPEERSPGASNTTGTPIQQIVARQGKQGRWKAIAAKNGIENPRAIHNPGAVDMSGSGS